MVKKIASFNRGTRHKFKKNYKRRGKISTTRYMQGFEAGSKVKFRMEPAIKSMLYHPKFHNRTGVVTGKRGSCYEVQVNDLGKQKTLIVHPVHLERA